MDIQLHELPLRDAIRQDGCPLCRLAEEHRRRRIAALFTEGVNDVGWRARMREGGLCRFHARLMIEQGDPLALSIVAADLVASRHAVLDRRVPACWLCEQDSADESSLVRTLASALRREPWREEYAASDGCCLSHAAALAKRLTAAAQTWLAQIEQDRLAALQEQLATSIRHFDHRDETPWGEERLCWEPALLKVSDR